MLSFSQWETLLRIASAACCALLLGKVCAAGLFRRYRAFTWLLAIDFAQALVSFTLDPNTNAYATYYFVSQPILWVMYYLVVLELFRLVLEDYPAIAGAGRLLLRYGLPAAIVVALLATFLLERGGESGPLLRAYISIEQAVDIGLFLLLLLIEFLLLYYPLRLNRNARMYCLVYPVYFGVKVATFMQLSNFEEGNVKVGDIALLASNCFCLLVWVFTLGRSGEVAPERAARWKPGESERLRDQLASINELLEKRVRNRK